MNMCNPWLDFLFDIGNSFHSFGPSVVITEKEEKMDKKHQWDQEGSGFVVVNSIFMVRREKKTSSYSANEIPGGGVKFFGVLEVALYE